jgi:hypothetical protein
MPAKFLKDAGDSTTRRETMTYVIISQTQNRYYSNKGTRNFVNGQVTLKPKTYKTVSSAMATAARLTWKFGWENAEVVSLANIYTPEMEL